MTYWHGLSVDTPYGVRGSVASRSEVDGQKDCEVSLAIVDPLNARA